MQFVEKFRRKFRNFGIENLMLYFIITIGAIWAADYIFPTLGLTSYLSFDRSMILHGQIWRLITFMFIPTTSHPLFVLLSLYFYYIIGTGLENYWGKTTFTLYIIIGWLLQVGAGFISGYAMSHYMLLSMFFAYAMLNPNEEFLMFFIIRIKAKYLAFIDALYMLADFIFIPSATTRLSIAGAVVLFLIFFDGDFIGRIKAKIRYKKFKDNFKNR